MSELEVGAELDVNLTVGVRLKAIGAEFAKTFGPGTKLSTINGGNGIKTGGASNDIRVTLSDGTAFEVNLDDSMTVTQLINEFNTKFNAAFHLAYPDEPPALPTDPKKFEIRISDDNVSLLLVDSMHGDVGPLNDFQWVGGAIASFENLMLSDLVIRDNYAVGFSSNPTFRGGGGIFLETNYGLSVLSNLVITGNGSAHQGGGLDLAANGSARIELNDSTIDGNHAHDTGGGVVLSSSYGNPTIQVARTTLRTGRARARRYVTVSPRAWKARSAGGAVGCLEHRHRDHRECFVDLEQVDVGNAPADLVEQFSDRRDRRGGEPLRLLAVGGMALDHSQ